MKPKEEDLLEKTKQWIEIAEEDFRFAKFGLTMASNVPYRLIAFHCQQCAEKYVKALLVFHCIDFPYTHSIEKLLELTPKEYALSIVLADARVLSDYAVSKRYPDFYKKLSKEETLKAIEITELIRKEINKCFLSKGFNFLSDID
ncbi:MAG: HEPN domain-containing protein [Ignavibacteriaceae bacterium]|nr:HEPN domain-containing protein [Ignavibacteriaceae bacterium]